MIEIQRVDPDKPDELEAALTLARVAFDTFVAPDYSPGGILEFHTSISPERIRPRVCSDEMQMWIALDGEVIVGMIALRSVNHIGMFFVDCAYHRKGIGRALYSTLTNYLRNQKREFVTVFSSPYAIEVYKRLGFTLVAEETIIGGMRCNPMCAYLTKEDTDPET